MQLDRSYLWFLDPAQSAMQTACGYACMCMWLSTFMLCGQFPIMHAIYAIGPDSVMQADCDTLCMATGWK